MEVHSLSTIITKPLSRRKFVLGASVILTASAFVGKRGILVYELKFEYQVMLTQNWVLSHEFEANIFSKHDREVDQGSGLSDITTGLRLCYEIEREFAPYIGIEWTKKFGDTAKFTKLEGENISQPYWVLGIKAWF